MKHNKLFRLISLLDIFYLIILVFSITSCSAIKYKNACGMPKWKAQLEMIRENDSVLQSYNLRFLDYKIDKKVNNLKEFERIKSDIAKRVFIYRNNILKYDSIANMNQYYSSSIHLLLPTSEMQLALVPRESDNHKLGRPLYYFKKKDLSKIIIRWKFNGKSLSTVCFVSENQGIVFDEILYFMASPKRNS